MSFESTLQLLYRLQDLVTEHNAQVIYATHSPLVAALPGAQILEMTDQGIAERKWAGWSRWPCGRDSLGGRTRSSTTPTDGWSARAPERANAMSTRPRHGYRGVRGSEPGDASRSAVQW